VGVLPQIPILVRAHVGELDLRACVEGGGQDVDHASGEDDPSHECLDDKEDVTIEAQCGGRVAQHPRVHPMCILLLPGRTCTWLPRASGGGGRGMLAAATGAEETAELTRPHPWHVRAHGGEGGRRRPACVMLL
jgi:hypothetical protein